MAAPWVEASLIALVASSSATFVFVQRSSAAGGEAPSIFFAELLRPLVLLFGLGSLRPPP